MYSQQEVENFLKKEDELVLLENKIQDLNRKDFLNAAESELLSELHLKANEIRRALPNKPVTLQNSVTSSRRPGAFKNLGEQLIAVRKAGTPGQQIDPRLKPRPPSLRGGRLISSVPPGPGPQLSPSPCWP